MTFSSNFIIVYTTFMRTVRTAVHLNELEVSFLGSLLFYLFLKGLEGLVPLFLHDGGKYMT